MVYTVAAVLYLKFAIHVLLLRQRYMLRPVTLALSVLFVQCQIWLISAIRIIIIIIIIIIKSRGCIGSCWGNRREGDHWGDLGVGGWIILGWISRRWDVGMWTGLGWPRIETGGGRL